MAKNSTRQGYLKTTAANDEMAGATVNLDQTKVMTIGGTSKLEGEIDGE